MSSNHLLSDILIRIKNAQLVNKKYVISSFSGVALRVLNILKTYRYISSAKKFYCRKNVPYLKIFLRYEGLSCTPAIKNISLISKPSRRVFISNLKANLLSNKPGITILSTSKGILTSKKAKYHRIGGELLCNIF